MDTALASWAGTLLAAKFFAGIARRDFGLAPDIIAWRRSGLSIDVAYLWLLAAFSAGVRWIGLEPALALAILLRLSSLTSTRSIVAANHYFVELFAMIVFLRAYHQPAALAAVVQVMLVSTWVYAAWQKIYHRQFVDGAFFCILFQDEHPAHRWQSMKQWVGGLKGPYSRVDPASQALCRRLAIMAVAMEIVAPIAALPLSGTWWSVGLLALAAVGIAYVSGETSFMITNLSLALLFLVPFDPDALYSIARDPVVGGILGYYLLWPPLHAVLTKQLRISSWKLGGWGMYATTSPRVSLVNAHGEIVPLAASVPLAAVEAFGACRISWVRAYVQGCFLKWHPAASHARGFLFQRYQRRGQWYVTEAIFSPVETRLAPTVLILSDDNSVSTFSDRLKALAAASAECDKDDRLPTVDTPQGITCSPLPNCIIKEV